MEVPSRLERHNRECYKGHRLVEVDLSLGRNRQNKLSIGLLNLMR